MSALQDAHEAVQYVRSQMQVLSMNRNTDKDNPVGGALIWPKVQGYEESYAELGPTDYIETAAKAHATLDLRLGNCDEMAALAFAYLAEKGSRHRPLDIFSVVDGDHAFVVIGRDAKAAAGHWGDWSPDVVICDPWVGEVYTRERAGEWLDAVAGLCLDKPADWVDFKIVTQDVMIGDKLMPETKSVGAHWNSVKLLRERDKDLSAIRLSHVVGLTSATWPYKVTGQ